MAVKAAEIANDKKANDTIVLQLKDLSTIADYLVICSGDNPAQVKAIAEAIDDYFSSQKATRLGREGMEFARWVLLDYGDIVINIFNEEARAFYDLEKMWIDAPRIHVEKE
jgi:ribosome-associated protein